MTHQSEHEALANKLVEAKLAAQEIYIEHHNGDKKLNKRIMAVRDAVNESALMLDSHKQRTAGDDAKVERYNNIVKVLWVVIPIIVAETTKLLGLW